MHRPLRLFIAFVLIFSIQPAVAGDLADIKQEFKDSVITTKITAKFTKDKDLNPLKISISTHGGVVVLTGYVKDKNAFVKALRLTKVTQGVVGVNARDLVIKRVNTALTDTYITTKVEAAVLEAKVFDDETIPLVGINAKTNNGVVTLSGEVKNRSSILAIVRRVNTIHGVKKIISYLESTEMKG